MKGSKKDWVSWRNCRSWTTLLKEKLRWSRTIIDSWQRMNTRCNFCYKLGRSTIFGHFKHFYNMYLNISFILNHLRRSNINQYHLKGIGNVIIIYGNRFGIWVIEEAWNIHPRLVFTIVAINVPFLACPGAISGHYKRKWISENHKPDTTSYFS